MYGLPAHIQVGTAEEPTPLQNTSKKKSLRSHTRSACGRQSPNASSSNLPLRAPCSTNHSQTWCPKCFKGYPGRIPLSNLFQQGTNSGNTAQFTPFKCHSSRIQRLLRMLPAANSSPLYISSTVLQQRNPLGQMLLATSKSSLSLSFVLSLYLSLAHLPSSSTFTCFRSDHYLFPCTQSTAVFTSPPQLHACSLLRWLDLMILKVFSNLDNSMILSRGNSELLPLLAYQHLPEHSDVQNQTLNKQNDTHLFPPQNLRLSSQTPQHRKSSSFKQTNATGKHGTTQCHPTSF